MFLIRDKQQSGISFWYPLYGAAQRAQPVKVVPWSFYQKALAARAGANIVLLVWGLLLFDGRIYSEKLFTIFYVLVLLATLIKIWKFFPRVKMTVTKSASIEFVPLALIDFCGTYLVFGIAMLVLAARAHVEVPTGKNSWSEQTYLFTFCVLGIAFLLFTLYTLMPAIAYWRRRAAFKESL
jgi:hypothetical protein